jgi:hypothetical protein
MSESLYIAMRRAYLRGASPTALLQIISEHFGAPIDTIPASRILAFRQAFQLSVSAAAYVHAAPQCKDGSSTATHDFDVQMRKYIDGAKGQWLPLVMEADTSVALAEPSDKGKKQASD